MQHVRLLVTGYHGYVALRFDVLVCSLGMFLGGWTGDRVHVFGWWAGEGGGVKGKGCM